MDLKTKRAMRVSDALARPNPGASDFDKTFKSAMEHIAVTEPGRVLMQWLQREIEALPTRSDFGALSENFGSRMLAMKIRQAMESQKNARERESSGTNSGSSPGPGG